MPIVFVHGVNVRYSSAYEEDIRWQKEKFKAITLKNLGIDPNKAKIIIPYWGDLGAEPAWDLVSLPSKKNDIQSFGAEETRAALMLAESGLAAKVVPKTVLLSVAQGSLVDAIDLVWSLAESDALPDEKKALIATASHASAYALDNPHPDWLNEVTNDEAFLTRLRLELKTYQPDPSGAAPAGGIEIETFGLDTSWRKIKEAVKTLGELAPQGLIEDAYRALRRSGSVIGAHFLGDVFVYLNSRGEVNQPGKIVQRIQAAIQEGLASISHDDPYLIIIAHSMGGQITWDILTHYSPEIECDAYVTVGSQVAFFQELRLLKETHPNSPGQIPKVTPPANIKNWINILDTNDLAAFAMSGVFERVTDYAYSTGKLAVGAHTTYFDRISFYQRLGARLLENFKP